MINERNEVIEIDGTIERVRPMIVSSEARRPREFFTADVDGVPHLCVRHRDNSVSIVTVLDEDPAPLIAGLRTLEF